MADYKETTTSGTKWQRARQIIIDNPRNESPSIMFVEEEVLNLGNEEIRRDVGNLKETLAPENVLTEIPLRNPLTNELNGQTATYWDLQVLLHSAYFYLGGSRDEKEAIASSIDSNPAAE